MPAETRHFFIGAAYATALGLIAWAALGNVMGLIG